MLDIRLHNQKLTRSTLHRAQDVVSWLGAVQAQDYAGAKWALALRASHLTDAAVDEAFAAGRILRTHVLRPTWHFIAPADIRWMLSLTAPRIHRVNRGYGRRLGMDDRLFARARVVMARALEGARYLTRTELKTALHRARITVAGQALAHVVIDAELEGLICSGPLRGREFTYALMAERVPGAPALGREEALGELTRRYFKSHGPATIRDFCWWSGLTVKDAKTGIAIARPELLAEPPELGRVRGATYLLSNYDEYLIAYKDRGAVIDSTHARQLSALVSFHYPHEVVIDGRVAGSWSRQITDTSLRIRLRIDDTLDVRDKKALTAQATRYGRFLGRSHEVEF